jgi:hypothetical protein
MLRTVVVNALAGPGAGKSTLSYGLIAKLKAEGHKAELVTEYAKELTWRRDFASLSNQFEVTREQDRRLRDLIGQVDFIVHDTALPLGVLYAKPPYNEEWHIRRCWELFDSYRNFNVFVTRKKKYQTAGRNQTEAEAVELDKRIRQLFDGRINIEVEGRSDAVDQVYDALMLLS